MTRSQFVMPFAGPRPTLVNAAVGRTCCTICALLTILLGGCSKQEKPGSGGSINDPAVTRNDDSATTSAMVVRQDLEFFSERYLPAEERLRRRQQRLLAVLDAPVTTGAAVHP